MKKPVLVINTGSSSIKFALYEPDGGGGFTLRYKGMVEEIGREPFFTLKDGEGSILSSGGLEDGLRTHDECFGWLEGRLGEILPGGGPSAVGHRVVHGGTEFTGPALIDDGVVARLSDMEPLAPLHQPYNVSGIRSMMKAYPGVPNVACFDTSFHRTQPGLAQMFGLPMEYYESGVVRYGFHGLSYEYVLSRLREISPETAAGRVVTAHLGAGASMCATLGGKSAATTMGFTALDGLPMGTRSGGIDPGVIFYLQREKGMTADEVEAFLYKKSGLLGISGLSSDMRDLEASDAPGAALAINYFAYRIVRETGSLAAALGGLDALVFTAGIGENSARVREKVCSGLSWLGIELDGEANSRNALVISTGKSPVRVYVIPTNEELVIAIKTANMISA
ncbi:MAG: acetate/propionate family kinase [Candidatus Dadabacteria bacterium]|nr:acetate/propionate family kinase [Candidatus Dadabacteria bacterium]